MALVNLGNTNYINAVVQLLINNTCLNMFFEKYYHQVKLEETTLGMGSLLVYRLGEICHHKNQKTSLYKPAQLCDTVYKMNIDTMGYEVKDVYELLKYLLNVIHGEQKVIIRMQDELQRNTNVLWARQASSQEMQDDWEQIKEIKNYMDTSIISDIFKGKLCAEYLCTNCH